MASVFDYIFNIGGNFKNEIKGMTDATGRFEGEVSGAKDKVQGMASTLAAFDYAKNLAQSTAQGFTSLTSAGVTLDRQMHDLSAVAGVTGESLKQIEGFARESAKTFGTDASVAVEGYKLLLSQLSPELGKYPEVLKAMGDNIQTTSKLMGGDGVAAAQVLTTAMNQYGVSLEDPMAASEEMARMMNVMAAAGQAGSAELPAISAALQQCGMAAKAANVSFEETNAAIQVLDKAGKKASEGGVALRNVLGQLSKGRFVEKAAREELEAAGIDVVKLGDNSLSLKERLEMLKPLLNDSALLSKFFGVENANAARALIQGTDSLQDFTEAVTGTNSATEQAARIIDKERTAKQLEVKFLTHGIYRNYSNSIINRYENSEESEIDQTEKRDLIEHDLIKALTLNLNHLMVEPETGMTKATDGRIGIESILPEMPELNFLKIDEADPHICVKAINANETKKKWKSRMTIESAKERELISRKRQFYDITQRGNPDMREYIRRDELRDNIENEILRMLR